MHKLTVPAICLISGMIFFPIFSSLAKEQLLDVKLLESVRVNDLAAVRKLIGLGADPFATYPSGTEAVEFAIDRGFFQVAHYLQAVQNQRLDSREVSSEKPSRIGNLSPPKNEKEDLKSILPEMHFLVQGMGKQDPKVSSEKAFPDNLGKEVSGNPNTDVKLNRNVAQPILVERNVSSQMPMVAENRLPQQVAIIDTSEMPEADRKAAKIVALPEMSDISDKMSGNKNSKLAEDLYHDHLREINPHRPKSFLNRLTELFVGKTQKGKANNNRKISANNIKDLNKSKIEIASVLNDINESPEISEPEAREGSNSGLTASRSKSKKLGFGVLQSKEADRSVSKIKLDTSLDSRSSASVELLDSRTASVYNSDHPKASNVDHALFNQFATDTGNKGGTTEIILEDWEKPRPDPKKSKEVVSKIIGVQKSFSKPVNLKVSNYQNTVLHDIEIESLRSFINKPPAVADMPDRNLKRYPISENDTSMLKNQVPQIVKPISLKVVEAKILSKNRQPENYNLSPAPINHRKITKSNDQSGVIELEVVNLLPEKASQNYSKLDEGLTQPKYFTKKSLKSDEIELGLGYRLGKELSMDSNISSRCLNKGGSSVLFCVESLKWEPEISEAFGIGSFFSGGGRAIIRYDRSIASQYHVLFPASSFSRIYKYFLGRFGTPSNQPKIWTPILGKPPRLNKTFQWRSLKTGENKSSILEIRQIDDLRWSGVPQVQYGVIRLYYSGDKPIFRTLTTTDLMMMQIKNTKSPTTTENRRNEG